MSTTPLDEFAEFVKANAHVLNRWPELAFQQAANTVTSRMDGQSAPAKAAVFRQVMGAEMRPWVRRLNPSPTASACRATYSGHEGSVVAIGITPDGNRIVSSGVDGTVRVWDMATGGAIEIARGFLGGSASFAMIPGTSMIAATGARNHIVLWDFDQLQVIDELEGTTFDISSIAVDQSGRWMIAAASSSGVDEPRPSSIVMYDLSNNSRVNSCSYMEGVGAAAIGDGGRVVYLASGSSIMAFDPFGARSMRSVRLDTENITRIRAHPAGRAIAVGQWGGRVTIHDADTLTETLRLPGIQAISQDLAFTPDGEELAVAGLDGTIKIWNRRGESLTTLRGHSALVTGVAFTPDGSRLVTSSVDSTVKVWDPRFDRDFFTAARASLAGRLAELSEGLDAARASALREQVLHAMHSSRKHTNSVTGVASAAGRAITAGMDDTVRIWNLDNGDCERALEGHEEGIWSLAANRAGTVIASADRAATLKLWDAATGSQLSTQSLVSANRETGGSFGQQLLREMQRPVISPLCFSPDGKLLGSADSIDNDIKVWDGRSLAPRWRLSGHSARVRALLFANGGDRLVTTAENGEIIAWDVTSGVLVARGGDIQQDVVAGRLGPAALLDDGTVACAWHDGSVRVLDPDSLAQVGTVGDPGWRVRSMVSGRGVLAVERAGSGETTVELWRQRERTLAMRVTSSASFVVCAFNDRGTRVALGGPADPLAIYDLDRGNRVRRYPELVRHIAFAGDRIVAGSEIGEVFLLEAVG
jgi:WD40 repeat protein